MSKRKGVSAEEKRQRVLQLFYEKVAAQELMLEAGQVKQSRMCKEFGHKLKDVFQLKELEKIAPKEKGVIAQAVKDVVQSLVDDGLVDSEKIGTSVYFWSFPSKAISTRKRKIEDLKAKLEDVCKKLKAVEAQVDKSERTQLLGTLAETEAECQALKAQVQQHRDCDPEVLEEVKAQAVTAKEAANRWTDNIFGIKSWAKNKFFIEESLLNKQFSIPEDLDYI